MSRDARDIGGATVAALVVAGVLVAVSQPDARFVSYVLLSGVPIAAAAWCVTAALRYRDHHGLAWRLAAAACASWGLGTVHWAVKLETGAGLHPYLAHIPYLLALPLLGAGILVAAADETRSSSQRRILDGGIIAGSLFLASWTLIIEQLWNSSGRPMPVKIISLAYPVGDVFGFALVMFVATNLNPECRTRLLTVGLGVAVLAVADGAYAYAALTGAYVMGDTPDAAYVAGFTLIALAAYRARPSDVPDPRVEMQTLRTLLPYIVAGFAAAIVVGHQITRGRVDAVANGGVLVVAVLVVIRQFVLVNEAQGLMIARLRQIDEMKTQILRAVSHELRTPLTFIKGASAFMADNDEELDPSTRRQLVGRLVENTDRLEHLVASLMDMDRLERGRVEPLRQPTDLRELVLAVAEDVSIGSRHLRVTGEAHGSVDRGQVGRIVENLLSNAARHTPEGTHIVATIERTDDGVRIVVEDDGPGIVSSDRDTVFEPFVQLEETHEGTGVGLSLVARFAELHGGRAWVEASASGGARFCVVLPDVTSAS